MTVPPSKASCAATAYARARTGAAESREQHAQPQAEKRDRQRERDDEQDAEPSGSFAQRQPVQRRRYRVGLDLGARHELAAARRRVVHVLEARRGRPHDHDLPPDRTRVEPVPQDVGEGEDGKRSGRAAVVDQCAVATERAPRDRMVGRALGREHRQRLETVDRVAEPSNRTRGVVELLRIRGLRMGARAGWRRRRARWSARALRPPSSSTAPPAPAIAPVEGVVVGRSRGLGELHVVDDLPGSGPVERPHQGGVIAAAEALHAEFRNVTRRCPPRRCPPVGRSAGPGSARRPSPARNRPRRPSPPRQDRGQRERGRHTEAEETRAAHGRLAIEVRRLAPVAGEVAVSGSHQHRTMPPEVARRPLRSPPTCASRRSGLRSDQRVPRTVATLLRP